MIPLTKRAIEEEIRFVESARTGIVALSGEDLGQGFAGVSHAFLITQLFICRQGFLKQRTCLAVTASCLGEAAQSTERSRYARPVSYFPGQGQALSQQHLCPTMVSLPTRQRSSAPKLFRAHRQRCDLATRQ